MRTPLFVIVLSTLAGLPPASRAADPQPAATPPADLSVGAVPSLDLLLAEPAPVARDARVEEQVVRRRTLLSAHQAAGLATWGLMGTTVVVGQLNYHDLYGGGGYTQRYRNAHLALASATAASFAFTGILALAAPTPYPKPVRFDTATVHKVSMGLTTAGLVGQIALGVVTKRSAQNLDQRRLAQAHQALGYATFGAMTIGAVTLLF